MAKKIVLPREYVAAAKRIAYWNVPGYVKQPNPLEDFMAEHPLEVAHYIDVPEELATPTNRMRYQSIRESKGERYMTKARGRGMCRIWRIK